MASRNHVFGVCDGYRIKTAYLSKLGIYPQAHPQNRLPQCSAGKRTLMKSTDSESTLTTQESVASQSPVDGSFISECFTLCDYEEPLVYNEDEENSFEFHLKKPASKVHFHESVTVLNIPSCRDLPRECRRSLWDSLKALEQNAKRNAYEFYFDDNDWKLATEEHNFVRTPNGKLLHPATWRAICNDIQRKNLQAYTRNSPIMTVRSIKVHPTSIVDYNEFSRRQQFHANRRLALT